MNGKRSDQIRRNFAILAKKTSLWKCLEGLFSFWQILNLLWQKIASGQIVLFSVTKCWTANYNAIRSHWCWIESKTFSKKAEAKNIRFIWRQKHVVRRRQIGMDTSWKVSIFWKYFLEPMPNKFKSIVVTLRWNKALWVDVPSLVAPSNQ